MRGGIGGDRSAGVQHCRLQLYLWLSRATADYNTGPISNEVAQVLQAANRSLTIISEPGNADRWRLSANAKSRGGAGNQNSIIYFETWRCQS